MTYFTKFAILIFKIFILNTLKSTMVKNGLNIRNCIAYMKIFLH